MIITTLQFPSRSAFGASSFHETGRSGQCDTIVEKKNHLNHGLHVIIILMLDELLA